LYRNVLCITRQNISRVQRRESEIEQPKFQNSKARKITTYIRTNVVTNISVLPISQRRHGQDKTVLSCLAVSVVWTELATRQDTFVRFPICNCSVSNTLRTTENLEIGNWVQTGQNCLVLTPILFTPPTRTRQNSFVLSVSAVWTAYESSTKSDQQREQSAHEVHLAIFISTSMSCSTTNYC